MEAGSVKTPTIITCLRGRTLPGEMQKSIITVFYRSVVILFLSMLKDQRGIFLIVEAQTPLSCLDGSVTVKYCTVHALDGQQMLSQGGKNKICVYIAY